MSQDQINKYFMKFCAFRVLSYATHIGKSYPHLKASARPLIALMLFQRALVWLLPPRQVLTSSGPETCGVRACVFGLLGLLHTHLHIGKKLKKKQLFKKNTFRMGYGGTCL